MLHKQKFQGSFCVPTCIYLLKLGRSTDSQPLKRKDHKNADNKRTEKRQEISSCRLFQTGATRFRTNVKNNDFRMVLYPVYSDGDAFFPPSQQSQPTGFFVPQTTPQTEHIAKRHCVGFYLAPNSCVCAPPE